MAVTTVALLTVACRGREKDVEARVRAVYLQQEREKQGSEVSESDIQVRVVGEVFPGVVRATALNTRVHDLPASSCYVDGMAVWCREPVATTLERVVAPRDLGERPDQLSDEGWKRLILGTMGDPTVYPDPGFSFPPGTPEEVVEGAEAPQLRRPEEGGVEFECLYNVVEQTSGFRMVSRAVVRVDAGNRVRMERETLCDFACAAGEMNTPEDPRQRRRDSGEDEGPQVEAWESKARSGIEALDELNRTIADLRRREATASGGAERDQVGALLDEATERRGVLLCEAARMLEQRPPEAALDRGDFCTTDVELPGTPLERSVRLCPRLTDCPADSEAAREAIRHESEDVGDPDRGTN